MSIVKEAVSNWRQMLKAEHARLSSDFLKHQTSRFLLKRLSQFTDTLLREVWGACDIHPDVCLIAVGGYGRQELFPHSDIDVLLLLPENLTEDQHQKIETLVGILWDIGLNVGHSVRTLPECVAEAENDVTVLTNLLEARLIQGQAKYFSALAHATTQALNPQQFLDKKLQEQSARHAKFNDTAYNLEPNLKESPGGLRDLNMVLWIAHSQRLGNTWQGLCKAQVISEKELRLIRRHERNLQNLRIRLHYLAKRREDRLLFDFQNDLAKDLGFENTSKKRASEQLMQGYYRSAKFISLINEILLKTFQTNLKLNDQTPLKINDRFSVLHGQLIANVGKLFQTYPSAILESFLILQQREDIEGFSATLIRELQRVKKCINQAFRQTAEHKRLFLAILAQPNGVNRALRNMNRYGILGQYIPAFGKIVGQMQHDLFHVYTVDEHILNVLRNLRRFSKPELAHEFPLCSRLFAEFNQPHLLYLAALFHDIAKGRGGDHSDLGTLDARRFCKLHGLPKQDRELVAWLVQTHLKMSSTAQKSDLSDPEVINQFAAFVGNEHRLIALYLLTVADIRGTSPAVWNAWKARLLEHLFSQTMHVLRSQNLTSQTQSDIRKQEVELKLNSFGLKTDSFKKLWTQFGDQYFIRFDSDEIAWQSRLLLPHAETKAPIVRARLSPKGDGIQVLIYCRNQDDIFARICHFFDNMHYNIAQAKIFTTADGYALDSFIVLEQSTKQVSYSGLLKYIEQELAKKITSNAPLDTPISGRLNRQVKHMPILTQVHIRLEPNTQHHQLEVIANDRPGLLATMAQQFMANGIDLHNAKINTLGNRVEDSFLISGKQGVMLSPEALQKIVKSFEKL
jgi:[protein-PII] uridylyltransferase